MSVATCVLRASGRRFAAKRYLATSTLVTVLIEPHAFEFVVCETVADDHDAILADAERFLSSPLLDLTRLFSFPGVERVALVFRVACKARSFAVPARLCAALGKHGLALEIVPTDYTRQVL